MQVLYWFESIRVPILDALMLAVTHLGEETAFLAFTLIVFWCVDKKRGYYLMGVGFLGTMANQFLKLLCRVPRPWVIDGNFTILEAARAQATGYSFPSGHTQTAVGTYCAIASTSQKRWVKAICITLAILVPISRMYVGVHTPYDVLVGAGMALLLVWLMKKPMMGENIHAKRAVFFGMIACAAALVLFVLHYPFGADVDEANLTSGLKNAYTMFGCTVGAIVVFMVDQKLDFPVKAVWWVQILKAVLGLAVVVAVKSLLKTPLEAILPVYPARALRYFLVVLIAGIVWPLTFRFFASLGKERINKLCIMQ